MNRFWQTTIRIEAPVGVCPGVFLTKLNDLENRALKGKVCEDAFSVFFRLNGDLLEDCVIFAQRNDSELPAACQVENPDELMDPILSAAKPNASVWLTVRCTDNIAGDEDYLLHVQNESRDYITADDAFDRIVSMSRSIEESC